MPFKLCRLSNSRQFAYCQIRGRVNCHRVSRTMGSHARPRTGQDSTRQLHLANVGRRLHYRRGPLPTCCGRRRDSHSSSASSNMMPTMVGACLETQVATTRERARTETVPPMKRVKQGELMTQRRTLLRTTRVKGMPSLSTTPCGAAQVPPAAVCTNCRSSGVAKSSAGVLRPFSQCFSAKG